MGNDGGEIRWCPMGSFLKGRVCGLGLIALVLGCAKDRALAQTAPEATQPPKMMVADAHPRFEVATIRPSSPNARGTSFRTEGRHIVMSNQPLANLIARESGFSRVLFCAAILYGVALVTFPAMRKSSVWHDIPAPSPAAE